MNEDVVQLTAVQQRALLWAQMQLDGANESAHESELSSLPPAAADLGVAPLAPQLAATRKGMPQTAMPFSVEEADEQEQAAEGEDEAGEENDDEPAGLGLRRSNTVAGTLDAQQQAQHTQQQLALRVDTVSRTSLDNISLASSAAYGDYDTFSLSSLTHGSSELDLAMQLENDPFGSVTSLRSVSPTAHRERPHTPPSMYAVPDLGAAAEVLAHSGAEGGGADGATPVKKSAGGMRTVASIDSAAHVLESLNKTPAAAAGAGADPFDIVADLAKTPTHSQRASSIALGELQADALLPGGERLNSSLSELALLMTPAGGRSGYSSHPCCAQPTDVPAVLFCICFFLLLSFASIPSSQHGPRKEEIAGSDDRAPDNDDQ